MGLPPGLYAEGGSEEAARPRPPGAANGAHSSPRSRALPRAPSRVGPTAAGAAEGGAPAQSGFYAPAAPGFPASRLASRGSAGRCLAAGAGLSGEEGCAFIGRAPAGEVPRAAHEPEGGQGWALPAPEGGRRWDGGRPLPSRGFGIPGPLSLFPVGDGRGLGDPTQPPPLLSQTGEMDARRA
ncbi:solute carrier family 25 member 51 isoform X2 [Mustela erminea]|uniref:solute carrier family 25 member 51 isoform X2 n=1 Tax=Mustela erminea TaxID=36723 RepID=UPI0013868885|nr:solute carrier family 25 member 51 isoform X2 [Mustela erminea]